MNRLSTFLSLFQGPPGPQGIPGPSGPQGKRGLDGSTHTTDGQIKLYVPIVVVYDGIEDLGHLSIGDAVGDALAKFYLEQAGLDLRVTVSGMVLPPWPIGPEYSQTVALEHSFRHRGLSFTVMVRSDVARLSSGRYLGEAFVGSKFCAVAGDQPPGPATAAAIAVHEFGHLLLGPSHEDGTFMRAELETENRIVTTTQRAIMRETAEHWRWS